MTVGDNKAAGANGRRVGMLDVTGTGSNCFETRKRRTGNEEVKSSGYLPVCLCCLGGRQQVSK